MTLEALTRRHTIDIYAVARTQDRGLQTVESLGTKVSTGVYCRAVSLSGDEQRRIANASVQFAEQFQIFRDEA